MDFIIIYEISIILLILLSAFFSGSETAIVSSSRLKIKSFSESGSQIAKNSLYILDNIEDAIGMVLIGNNIVNIAATSFIIFIATKAFSIGDKGLVIVTAIETFIFLILCEVTPKIVAKARAESFLMFFSFPIKILMVVLKPFVRFSLFFTDFLKSILKLKKTDNRIIKSRDEIDLFFRLGEKDGVIDEDNKEFVSEILSFKDLKSTEVMTSTIDLITIEASDSKKNLVNLFHKTRFSRIPVYKDRVDNIIGFIFYRDILLEQGLRKISTLVREPIYIPSTKNILQLYYEIQKDDIELVFVVNESGAVIGMITHEDIIEEVVGEIQTEEQSDMGLIEKIDESSYLIDATLDIEYFQKYFSIELKKEGFETVAGFITFKMDKIPIKGESFLHNNFKFTVEETTGRSVKKIILKTDVKTL